MGEKYNREQIMAAIEVLHAENMNIMGTMADILCQTPEKAEEVKNNVFEHFDRELAKAKGEIE